MFCSQRSLWAEHYLYKCLWHTLALQVVEQCAFRISFFYYTENQVFKVFGFSGKEFSNGALALFVIIFI